MALSTSRPYSGRSADERSSDRRERLLAAATELFGTRGYAATPVGLVCSTAQVSTRHFYATYANREDLLLDLHATVSRAALERAVRALEDAADEPVRARIAGAVEAYVGTVLADPRTARISFVEVVGVSDTVEERRLALRDAIIAVIRQEGERAVERGEIAPRDFRFAGLALIGAINSVAYDWTVDRGGVGADELVASLSECAALLLLG